jgi:hypothetical protein
MSAAHLHFSVPTDTPCRLVLFAVTIPGYHQPYGLRDPLPLKDTGLTIVTLTDWVAFLASTHRANRHHLFTRWLGIIWYCHNASVPPSCHFSECSGQHWSFLAPLFRNLTLTMGLCGIHNDHFPSLAVTPTLVEYCHRLTYTSPQHVMWSHGLHLSLGTRLTSHDLAMYFLADSPR